MHDSLRVTTTAVQETCNHHKRRPHVPVCIYRTCTYSRRREDVVKWGGGMDGQATTHVQRTPPPPHVVWAQAKVLRGLPGSGASPRPSRQMDSMIGIGKGERFATTCWPECLDLVATSPSSSWILETMSTPSWSVGSMWSGAVPASLSLQRCCTAQVVQTLICRSMMSGSVARRRWRWKSSSDRELIGVACELENAESNARRERKISCR